MPRSLVALAALALACAVPAQTGHTVHLASAPVVNTNLRVQLRHPPSDGGSRYFMLLSTHTNGSITIPLPQVKGVLLLNPASTVELFQGVLSPTGITANTVPVPNKPTLVGQNLDIQSATIQASTFDVLLSDNDVVVTMNAGIGSILIADGTIPSTATGDLALLAVTNGDMGVPTTLMTAPGAFQVIRTHGQRGWVEGYPATFSATPGASDIRVHRRDRVARNLINGVAQTIALPNGFDLAIVRDRIDCKKFMLLSLARASATATVLSGSTYTDTALVCPPTGTASAYRPQVAVTDDGEVAVVIRHDSANAHTPNAGPPDRILLVKTDPAKTWPNGLNTLDVSPTAQPVHAWFDGSLRIAGELFFAEGPDPSGAGGNAVLYAGPIDGTAPMTRVTVPTTGTGLSFHQSHGEWRTSADGRTMAFRIGGGTSASSVFDDDVIAITNISKAGPLSVANVSGFAAQTQLAAFGIQSIGTGGIRTDLSPDGARIAFVAGGGTAASPHRLFVAPTDGSQAGTLTSVLTGAFDPQVVFVGNVHFARDDKVLFLAGSDGGACDWYAFDVPGGTVSRLTGTATGSPTQPFTAGGTTGNIRCRGTFRSDSGRYLYFVRGFGGTRPQVPPLTNNLVAIDTQTLSLVDITGNDFATGGTAPSIWRGPSLTTLTMTDDPRPALELQVRRAGAGDLAFFAAEPAQGASATVYNDCNVFAFDIENAGRATQLTSYTGQGVLSSVKLINHLTASPDGTRVAWAERKASASESEDVFLTLATGGTPVRMSLSQPGQTVTDGSIAFSGGPVDGLAWSVGTGSLSVPFQNAVAQWSRVQGQIAPLLLTEPPVAAPLRVVLVLGAGPVNP
jgi:hypothetical protein